MCVPEQCNFTKSTTISITKINISIRFQANIITSPFKKIRIVCVSIIPVNRLSIQFAFDMTIVITFGFMKPNFCVTQEIPASSKIKFWKLSLQDHHLQVINGKFPSFNLKFGFMENIKEPIWLLVSKIDHYFHSN